MRTAPAAHCITHYIAATFAGMSRYATLAGVARECDDDHRERDASPDSPRWRALRQRRSGGEVERRCSAPQIFVYVRQWRSMFVERAAQAQNSCSPPAALLDAPEPRGAASACEICAYIRASEQARAVRTRYSGAPRGGTDGREARSACCVAPGVCVILRACSHSSSMFHAPLFQAVREL